MLREPGHRGSRDVYVVGRYSRCSSTTAIVLIKPHASAVTAFEPVTFHGSTTFERQSKSELLRIPAMVAACTNLWISIGLSDESQTRIDTAVQVAIRDRNAD